MSRQLTQGEMKLAKDVFGSSIDLARVRIHDEKYIFFQPRNSGMTPNGEIYVHGAYRADYSNADADLQAFFIHEMVHVWQHQTGVLKAGVIGSAIMEMIGHVGDYAAAYSYSLDGAKDLTDYGLEQQAAIVEDYVRLTRLGIKVLHAAPPVSRALYEEVLNRFLTDPTYGHRPYQRVCAVRR